MISSEALLLLIVTLLVSGSIGIGVIALSDDVGGAIESVGESFGAELEQDVKIVSDRGSDALYDDGVLMVHVQNTGDEVLEPDDTVLFVDGESVEVDELVVVGESETWGSGDILRVDAEVEIDGVVGVQVVVGSASDSFRVEAGGGE